MNEGFCEYCFCNLHQNDGGTSLFCVEFGAEQHLVYRSVELVLDRFLALKRLELSEEEFERAKNILKFTKLHPKTVFDYVLSQNYTKPPAARPNWKSHYVNGEFRMLVSGKTPLTS